jgi:hypothetical protein
MGTSGSGIAHIYQVLPFSVIYSKSTQLPPDGITEEPTISKKQQ